MTMTHDLEREILLKLIHNPHLKFNELWAKNGESNTFAYHVNKLEREGYIEKDNEGGYGLTVEGKKMSAFIEGDTGLRADLPTPTVVLLVKNNDQWLCQKRLKEPFFGYWGFVSGKINFGQNIFECATRDLLEETGLHSKSWKLKCLEQVKTFEGDKLLFHHLLFTLITEDFTGELKDRTHKAEHKWMTLDQYAHLECFPSDILLNYIVPAEKPLLIEAERFMKDGKFSHIKLVSVNEF